MCLLLPLDHAISKQPLSSFFSLTLFMFPALEEPQATLSVKEALG